MQALKNLFENKSFDTALLTAIAAGAAVFGFNVPVLTILALISPVMIAIGAAGWQEVTIAQAKVAQETAIKLHLLTTGLKAHEIHDAMLAMTKPSPVKTAQAGFGKLSVMLLIAAIGVGSASFAVSVTSTGCATVKPIVTDVIDCAKAEAAVVSDGYSILQIFAKVAAAIAGGPDEVLTKVEGLIADYGESIVACAIDSYPEPAPPPSSGSGAGSGSGAPPLLASSKTVLQKHALLAKYFPGKKIQRGKSK